MNAKERILTIRIINRIKKNPVLLDKLKIEILDTRKKDRKDI